MRTWILLAAGLMASALAWAAPPLLVLRDTEPEVNLTPLMALHRVADRAPADPDTLWAAPVADVSPALAPEYLRLNAGEAVVGRLRLGPGRRNDVYMVEVTSARIDQVQVWTRADGGPWQGGEAGDRVPLKTWPFTGPTPAFSVPLGQGETELIVVLRNEGRMDVPVVIRSDKAFAQARMRQSNLSGLVMGMAVMVAVVCLIAAITRRRTSAWVLFAYALWSGAVVTIVNGYAAIWFFPDWPSLADGGKHFAPVLLAALMLWVTITSVDRLKPGTWLHVLGPVVTAVAVVYGALQFWVLPASWRVAGVVLFSLPCIAAGLWLCLLSRLGGGRYADYVGAGVLAFALVIVLAVSGPPPVFGLDVRSALAACLLFSGALSFRHAQFSRDRYGRDVLGRAAVGLQRDPLTALLTHAGLRQACEEILLRQRADGRPSQLLYLVLPGLKQAEAEHGFVLTERALVRLAALLQRTLGEHWAIARLSQDRLACVAHNPGQVVLSELSTRLLAQCARLTDPLSPLAHFGLRIVACERHVDDEALNATLQEMENAARAIRPGRRIAQI